MKKKLEDPLISILHTRTTLSKDTKLFYLNKLAKGWGMHPSTVTRYDDPSYRKYANDYAKRKAREPKINRAECQDCHTLLEGHVRCPDCTMLVHGKPTCGCKYYRDFFEDVA